MASSPQLSSNCCSEYMVSDRPWDLSSVDHTIRKRFSQQLAASSVMFDKVTQNSTANVNDLLAARGAIEKALSRVAEDTKSYNNAQMEAIASLGSQMKSTRDYIQNFSDKPSKAARGKKTHELILAELLFEEMPSRSELICEAYSQTYNWIYRDSSIGFERWLRTGKGFFWICGEAGSGKSTLMKYVGSNPKTRSLLEQWAGKPNRLIIVSCYFWYLGTSLQKSMEGLLRSILYQIFAAWPEVIEAVVPDMWAACQDSTDYMPAWTKARMIAALTKVTASCISDPHRNPRASDPHFCLFIDGLDEYSGDLTELLDILKRLSQNPRVKLCVSSRPWNAFRNAYSCVPSLRLEDLSKSDILRYTAEKLRQAAARTMPVPEERLVEDMITEVSSTLR